MSKRTIAGRGKNTKKNNAPTTVLQYVRPAEARKHCGEKKEAARRNCKRFIPKKGESGKKLPGFRTRGGGNATANLEFDQKAGQKLSPLRTARSESVKNMYTAAD